MKYILIVLFVFIAFSAVAAAMALKKQKNMENWKNLYKGMTLEEAVKLMGKDYTEEKLPKYTKYEWTITSSHYKGINDVIVHVSDGKVTDIQKFTK